MSSIRRGEIVYLEWLGGITLGSDMIKDLFLPFYFILSLQIIQYVILYFFSEAAVGKYSSKTVFLKMSQYS